MALLFGERARVLRADCGLRRTKADHRQRLRPSYGSSLFRSFWYAVKCLFSFVNARTHASLFSALPFLPLPPPRQPLTSVPPLPALHADMQCSPPRPSHPLSPATMRVECPRKNGRAWVQGAWALTWEWVHSHAHFVGCGNAVAHGRGRGRGRNRMSVGMGVGVGLGVGLGVGVGVGVIA